MGTDIHCYLEVQTKDKKWHLHNAPYIHRNYNLFTLMAGIRDREEEPISEPRGLPKDISKIVKLEAKYWGNDAHSHSWLSAKELTDVHNWLIEKGNYKSWDMPFGYILCNGYEIEDIDSPYIDCRLVFWFDN